MVPIFTILLIFFNVNVWSVSSTFALPHIFNYYQTRKYTKSNSPWLQKSTKISHNITELPFNLNSSQHSTNSAVTNLALTNSAQMLKPKLLANSNATNPHESSTNNNALLQREEGSFCRRSFDGRSGYCILASQCLHTIREHRMHGTKIDICTYRKSIPVICCTLDDKHIDDQRRLSAQKCQEYHDTLSDVKIEQMRTFSGKSCVTSVPMIVGGVATSSGDYPHMAALGWTQNEKTIKWGCGGALISDLFVLTAAHCASLSGKPPDMVRLGAENLNLTSNEQVDIKILVIILHPKYHSSSYYHDIALLKLMKRVQFSHRIAPACLWQLPDMKFHMAIAAGWGRTKFMGHKWNELQKVDLPLINQKTCKDIYMNERRLPHGIMDGIFCAGHLEGGKDTCQGDSGGPLHAELPEYNCVKFIVGITSFGKFCAAPNAPGVYTKVYSYLDWIEKIVFRN